MLYDSTTAHSQITILFKIQGTLGVWIVFFQGADHLPRVFLGVGGSDHGSFRLRGEGSQLAGV